MKVDTPLQSSIQVSAQCLSSGSNTYLVYSVLPDQSIDLLKSLLVPADGTIRSIVMPSRQNRPASNKMPDLIQTAYVPRAAVLQRCVDISRLISWPEPDKLNAAECVSELFRSCYCRTQLVDLRTWVMRRGVSCAQDRSIDGALQDRSETKEISGYLRSIRRSVDSNNRSKQVCSAHMYWRFTCHRLLPPKCNNIALVQCLRPE